MLPCNVIVQERAEGGVELAAIDPRAAMQRVGNPALAAVAEEVAERLARVVQAAERREIAARLPPRRRKIGRVSIGSLISAFPRDRGAALSPCRPRRRSRRRRAAG